MGVSKNAIVGKRRRLELAPGPEQAGNAPKKSIPWRDYKGAKAVATARKRSAPRPAAPVIDVSAPAVAATSPTAEPDPLRAVASSPLVLYATGGWGCQFITRFDPQRPARSLYCGKPRSSLDSAWCSNCRKIVYDKQPSLGRFAPRLGRLTAAPMTTSAT